MGWIFYVSGGLTPCLLILYSVLASIKKTPIAISAMPAAMKMPAKGATMSSGGSLYVKLTVSAPIKMTSNPRNFSAIVNPMGFSSLMLTPSKAYFYIP